MPTPPSPNPLYPHPKCAKQYSRCSHFHHELLPAIPLHTAIEPIAMDQTQPRKHSPHQTVHEGLATSLQKPNLLYIRQIKHWKDHDVLSTPRMERSIRCHSHHMGSRYRETIHEKKCFQD